MKHRVQQQVKLATPGADDQVGSADGAGERLADFGAQVLDAQQQGHAQSQCQADQSKHPAAIPEAGGSEGEGKFYFAHGVAPKAC